MIDVESTTTDDRRAEFPNVFEAVDTEYQPAVIEYDADCGGGQVMAVGLAQNIQCKLKIPISLSLPLKKALD